MEAEHVWGGLPDGALRLTTERWRWRITAWRIGWWLSACYTWGCERWSQRIEGHQRGVQRKVVTSKRTSTARWTSFDVAAFTGAWDGGDTTSWTWREEVGAQAGQAWGDGVVRFVFAIYGSSRRRRGREPVRGAGRRYPRRYRRSRTLVGRSSRKGESGTWGWRRGDPRSGPNHTRRSRTRGRAGARKKTPRKIVEKEILMTVMEAIQEVHHLDHQGTCRSTRVEGPVRVLVTIRTWDAVRWPIPVIWKEATGAQLVLGLQMHKGTGRSTWRLRVRLRTWICTVLCLMGRRGFTIHIAKDALLFPRGGYHKKGGRWGDRTEWLEPGCFWKCQKIGISKGGVLMVALAFHLSRETLHDMCYWSHFECPKRAESLELVSRLSTNREVYPFLFVARPIHTIYISWKYIYSYISNIYIFIHYICPWSIWKNLLWQVSSPQWKSDGSHRKETHPAILLVTGKDTEKSLIKTSRGRTSENPTEFMTSKASPNSQGSRNRSGAKDDGRCHLPCGWPVGCCLCSWLSRRAWSKKNIDVDPNIFWFCRHLLPRKTNMIIHDNGNSTIWRCFISVENEDFLLSC